MIDLSKFLPGLAKNDELEEPMSAYEYHRLHAPKHGPVKMRSVTSGQVRRAQARWTEAQKRKANRRYRKQWVANETAYVRLGSQLALIVKRPDSALVPGVVRVLEERYGSVEAATEHFADLTAERRA